MKTNFPFTLMFLFLFFISCDKEEQVVPEEDMSIVNISLPVSPIVEEPQEIAVTIHKPTPCHKVKETIKTVSGRTFNYDFILVSGSDFCITVLADETVVVSFDPTEPGEHTINFLINGSLFQTRTITVTD